MPQRAGVDRFVRIDQQAVDALVEVMLVVPARGVAAQLVGALQACAVLAVELPEQVVGERGIQRIQFVAQRHPRAGLMVAAVLRQDALRCAGAARIDTAQRLDAAVVLIALHGELEALLRVGRIHQLAQHAAAIDLLRIGCGAGVVAGAVIALVLRFLALAMAHGDHAAPALATERAGGAGEQAVPVAFVAELQSHIAVLVGAEVIRRILGHEGHHTAQCIGAIQRTGRATHHLDPLERFQVNEIAVSVEIAAEIEGVRHRHVVDQDRHAVAIQTADAHAAGTGEAPAGAGDRHARRVTEQILELAHQLVVQLLAVDHIHGARHLHQGALGARGGDLQTVEVMHVARRGSAGIGFGFGFGGNGAQGNNGQRQ